MYRPNFLIIMVDQMNGTLIPDEQVQQLLELANWAPTHAFTEPWRFTVYAGEGKKTFCRAHAEMYRANTPADKFAQPVFERLADEWAQWLEHPDPSRVEPL